MRFYADLHIHSRYSRATSQEMEVETLSRWGAIKGIGVLGTGDFTHPAYFGELRAKLVPSAPGLYTLKKGGGTVHFMLTVEVSNVFSQGGRSRRIHTLVFAPSLEVVERINTRLAKRGKLSADGRPMFGFPAKDLVKLVLDVSPECVLVPAHAWTPWYSVFGANSGFDAIEECFEEEARHIFAIETGLSSDPAMNWRLSALDRVALLSNSDAHSPSRIGREANAFDTELSYPAIVDAIRRRDPARFLLTIEFFPEEGKYHYDGHRACDVLLAPAESRRTGKLCPVCRKGLTVGVLHRVEELADRPAGHVRPDAIPYRNVIPLEEIIAEALGIGTGTAGVGQEYDRLIAKGGSEFRILLELTDDELARICPPRTLEGILRMRRGQVSIRPGYDGVYGKISLFEGVGEPAASAPRPVAAQQQMSLF